MSSIRVLVIFANPRNTPPLRLGAEDRAIREALRLSRGRNDLEVICRHATTIHDLRRALLEETFHIVHISGHGISGGLILEDERGNEQLIPQKALATLFKVYSPPLQCVILNACYSLLQGKIVSLGVPFTIAMEGTIDDEAAVEFSRGFYDAIGAGKSIDFAYGEGCRAVALTQANPSFLSKLLRQRFGKRRKLPISGDNYSSPRNTIANKQQNNPQRPLKLFFSYTHEDRHWLEKLKKHLANLVEQGYLQTWDDSQINPGNIWAETVNRNLLNADIVLFLITPDFMGSDYAFNTEVRTILRRLREKKTTAIPVILSPADWKNSPLVDLKPLPKNGQSLGEWANLEAGFLDIVEGIRDICQKLITKQSSSTTSVSSPGLPEKLRFDDVFVKSGTPDFTFVEYPDFKRLKFAIAKPGRGVVIEGPSGIGKTTAVKKAIEEVVLSSQISSPNTSVQVLSARNPRQLQQIQTLQDWHQGTIVIDDFHRLDETLRQYIVDYLKYLADTEPESQKLVIVGIPYTRQKLVKLSFDLATRIDMFSLSRINDHDIQTMIEKGEKALNIIFDDKAEIVKASSGSLNIAQYICNTICSTEEIVETQIQQRWVNCDMKTVVASVMADLSTKFDETLHNFVCMGGQRNSIALRLLEELARREDGVLSLFALKTQRPDLVVGINRFIDEKWIDDLYQDYPVSKYQLFFDRIGTALIADDPQLIFYLKKTRFSQLAKQTGKVTSLAQCKVFISYSHNDIQWLSRLQVHLKPLGQERVIDIWADTDIITGIIWKDKIQEALDVAKVALVLVSADFLASDFVIKHELPKLLSNASSSGTIIIPIVLSPCLFKKSELAVFQSVNSPDSPLSSLDFNTQESTLVHAAEVVSYYLENEEA